MEPWGLGKDQSAHADECQGKPQHGTVGTMQTGGCWLGGTKPTGGRASSPWLIIQQIAFPATPEACEEPLTFIDVHLVLGAHMTDNILPGFRGMFNCQSPVHLKSS